MVKTIKGDGWRMLIDSLILQSQSRVLSMIHIEAGRDHHHLVLLKGLALPLPVIDMFHDRPRGRLRRILTTDALDEVVIGICQTNKKVSFSSPQPQEEQEKKNIPIR